jgi:integrative and conjugative element protein (TIGR02256 family)
MMDGGFHELANVEEVQDSTALIIPRARAVLDAARRHRDYEVVRLLRHRVDGDVQIEVLVVDVTCDAVPPRNLPGIQYRERLALCVPADSARLVEVLALRKDFPMLLHQNQSAPMAPASLCLYFEPPLSVLRTWTPQKFLRRIQWWLEQSAREALHPADQPVEQLFFVTPYELVLPWNFEALRQRPAQRFCVRLGPKRPNDGVTFFVVPAPDDVKPEKGTVAPINLTLPPILHGRVERDPTTLGELADALSARGVDVLTMLQEVVLTRVGAQGADAAADDPFTVVLLHVPIIRVAGADPERIAHRAFLLNIGPLRLGESMGTLFKHDKRYFRAMGLLVGAPATTWREQSVFPMEIMRFNDAESARTQSGIAEAGPTAVMIGAGALGSALLNLWGRSGWGAWTVIDKDHVKPHNLARHAAFVQHVGEPKSQVVAELHDAVMGGATSVTAVCADATHLDASEVRNALATATLVVDASTTLDYPRRVSSKDGVGRHVSVFVAPDGNAAVLLAEDEQRAIRLRSLEAQYYRALINEPWGERHLDSNLGTFWSGAGCRDISVVLPYSRLLGHAAALAEQVQRVAADAGAAIRIWSRDARSGAVAVHEVSVESERCLRFEGLDLFVDHGVEVKLRSIRAASLPSETGGVLLGYYDLNERAVVVVDALPAPADSRSSSASFERGIQGLKDRVAESSRRTAGIVGYIGEWHSHPPWHSAEPSRDDWYQLVYLALGMADDGLPALSLIVGENDFSVLQGVVRP